MVTSFSNIYFYKSKSIFNDIYFKLKSYEWFGHSVSAYLGYVIVGAPQSRICAKPTCETSQNDIQSVGRAYVFLFPQSTPYSVFTGTTEFEQLGYSVDASSQRQLVTFAISSPSKDTRLNNQLSYELNRAGIVQIYQQASPSDYRFSWRATLKSDRPYSGFGSKVKVGYSLNSIFFLIF